MNVAKDGMQRLWRQVVEAEQLVQLRQRRHGDARRKLVEYVVVGDLERQVAAQRLTADETERERQRDGECGACDACIPVARCRVVGNHHHRAEVWRHLTQLDVNVEQQLAVLDCTKDIKKKKTLFLLFKKTFIMYKKQQLIFHFFTHPLNTPIEAAASIVAATSPPTRKRSISTRIDELSRGTTIVKPDAYINRQNVWKNLSKQENSCLGFLCAHREKFQLETTLVCRSST